MEEAALATNIVLAIITAIYAALTFWLAWITKRAANSSEIAAKAAQQSAEAAKSAAESTERGAVAATASLEVPFDAKPEFVPSGPRETLLYRVALTNTGSAAVTVHDFRLDPVFIGVQNYDDGNLDIDLNGDGRVTRTGPMNSGRQYFFHQGEEISLELDPLELGSRQSCEGYVVVKYSIDGIEANSRTYLTNFEYVRPKRP